MTPYWVPVAVVCVAWVAFLGYARILLGAAPADEEEE